ncbi:MAG: PhaM family polyhydroxyalkanoate granule multifunctional regulatory protein, partial [Actinomycetota bacterium]
MSNDNSNANDPLGFVRNMWGNMGFSLPGMVAPTFDVDELEKRIKDLKAVEGWLKMNLSMLQATIQGLEMQVTTINTVKSMGTMAANAAQQAADSMARPSEPAPAAPAAPEAPAPGMGPEAAEALS